MGDGSEESFRLPEITEGTVLRYRQNYGIPEDTVITQQMVRQHVELEHRLTERLVNSRPQERATLWEESYGQLYRDLPWLAGTSAVSGSDPDVQFHHFLDLVPPGSEVIEIGSGAGSLARYLSEHGRPCVATDISTHRGGSRQTDSVAWHLTDGVHLDEFEVGRKYDVVLSTQVIEHLHPDDVQRHFEGAVAVTKPGGRYVFNTPHVYFGPADLSRVLLYDRARFMHLKEYTHLELGTIAKQAGFTSLEAVYVPPARIRAKMPFMLHGEWLYRYLTGMERVIGTRRLPRPLLRILLFHSDVFIVARRG